MSGNGNNSGSGGKGKNNATTSGFVWDQIEKFINDKLSLMSPFGKSATEGFMQKHPEWVERLVSQVLEKTLPKSTKTSATKPEDGITSEIFETHRHVIAKIKLPPKEHLKSMQVLVRSDQIKLQRVTGGDPHFIRLPVPVLASTARALYREGILQVQARKRKKGSYYEAYVE